MNDAKQIKREIKKSRGVYAQVFSRDGSHDVKISKVAACEMIDADSEGWELTNNEDGTVDLNAASRF